MKKLNYVRPLAEVTEIGTDDIIVTSGLTDSTLGSASVQYIEGGDYDKIVNESGTRIKLN